MSRAILVACFVCAAIAGGCVKNKKHHDNPPAPSQPAAGSGKAAPTKEGAGLPAGGGTQPAPVGAGGQQPADAPPPSSPK